ncbi:unnamed protein product [Boreogadus saida]
MSSGRLRGLHQAGGGQQGSDKTPPCSLQKHHCPQHPEHHIPSTLPFLLGSTPGPPQHLPQYIEGTVTQCFPLASYLSGFPSDCKSVDE